MNNIDQIQEVLDKIEWWNVSLELVSINVTQYFVTIVFHVYNDPNGRMGDY